MERNRLSVFLFFLILSGLFNQVFSQTTTDKLAVNYTNLKFSDILDSLSGRFGVNFSYNADLPSFNKSKSISCNSGLDDILKILLKDEGLQYEILGKQVIISRDLTTSENDTLYKKDNGIVIARGTITDKKTHEPLPFASVTLKDRSIGTVGNTNGGFVLVVPDSLKHGILEFSYMGYKPEAMLIDSISGKPVNIELSVYVVSILEIVVKPVIGLEIVKDVINNINKNYSAKKAMYTAFYRETAREKNDYISVCEAVLEIAKAPYNNSLNDQARIFKERKSENVKKTGNLAFKLEGGIYNCLRLDVIKDNASFLSPDYFESYDYQYVKKMTYDNREIIVVAFDQKKGIEMPLYKGTMYVDEESKALVAVDFSLSPAGIKYAVGSLVKKQPSKSQVKPVGADYKVFYRRINGKWYPAYMRAELRIRAKSNKLLFNSLFTSVSEMAVTDIDTTNKSRFRWSEVAKSQDITEDNMVTYDENFWNGYNMIQPEKSMIEAIDKLNIKKGAALKENFWDRLF